LISYITAFTTRYCIGFRTLPTLPGTFFGLRTFTHSLYHEEIERDRWWRRPGRIGRGTTNTTACLPPFTRSREIFSCGVRQVSRIGRAYLTNSAYCLLTAFPEQHRLLSCYVRTIPTACLLDTVFRGAPSPQDFERPLPLRNNSSYLKWMEGRSRRGLRFLVQGMTMLLLTLIPLFHIRCHMHRAIQGGPFR